MRHFESFLDINGEFVAGKSTEIVYKKDDYELDLALGILNSSLVKFYIKESYSVLGIDGGINFTTDLIGQIPLPDFPKYKKITDEIADTVNSIITHDTFESNLLKKIDELVMDLYCLTESEKDIIRKF